MTTRQSAHHGSRSTARATRQETRTGTVPRRARTATRATGCRTHCPEAQRARARAADRRRCARRPARARRSPATANVPRRGRERHVRLPRQSRPEPLDRAGQLDEPPIGSLPHPYQRIEPDRECRRIVEWIAERAEHQLAPQRRHALGERGADLTVGQHEAARLLGERQPAADHLCRRRQPGRAARRRPRRRDRCRRAAAPDGRAASTNEPSGSSMPSIGTSAIGRSVITSRRSKAIATGRVDSLTTSITVTPPASAHVYTVCTTSPCGTRTRVSVTGVPRQPLLSHRRLDGRDVPTVVGRDEPVQRRRPVPRLDRTPRRDRRAPGVADDSRGDHRCATRAQPSSLLLVRDISAAKASPAERPS